MPLKKQAAKHATKHSKGGDAADGVVRVLIEQGKTRVFARALDWPGWCRSAKTEALAIDALHAYAMRYAVVARAAGATLPSEPRIEVVERVPGDASTDFGAPHVIAHVDHEELDDTERERWIAVLEACWATFDAVASASGEELRKGPRGGGRDRSKMIDHVLEAERAYASKLGVRLRAASHQDAPGTLANRVAVVAALRDRSASLAPTWPLRYWVHRSAWHVLDHAWEIADKQIVP